MGGRRGQRKDDWANSWEEVVTLGGNDQSQEGGTNGRKEVPKVGRLGSCMGGREER